jgi:hypothetical protein
MKMQKLGGYASIVFVLVSIVRFSLDIQMFRGFTGLDSYDPAKMMAAYQASPILFWTFYVLGMLNGILVILVALALQERMQSKAPNLTRLVVIAASIYAALLLTNQIGGVFRNVVVAATKDDSAYRAFLLLHGCLGRAASNAWGWGLLLIGWAALRTRALPRILGYIILVYGIVGIMRFATTQLTYVYALLSLVSMGWLGIVLLRKPEASVG